jgi:hypothetical protein
MANERIRQILAGRLSADQLEKFQNEGWRAVAIEWEREVPEPAPATSAPEDPPFGLRVAKDCATLEEHPAEAEVLATMMELIIEDGPYSVIAEQLNRRGYRTRQGSKWSAVSVFEMLPRLIEAGPKIFSTEGWQRRRQESRQRAPRLPI